MSRAKQQTSLRDRITEFRRVKRGDVAPNPHNFRLHPDHQRAALRGLLSEIGIAGAALAYYSERNDGRLTYIDGHLRDEEIPDGLPVLVTDLNDSEADLLLASYDPISALAEADKSKLDSLLREVSTGDAAVAEMLAGLASENGLYFGEQEKPTEDESAAAQLVDRAGELQSKWQVQSGNLYQIGPHRLLCGDSTDASAVARLMDGRSVKYAISDPPYGISVDTAWLSALHIQRGKPANISDDRLQGDDGSLDTSCAFNAEKWLVWGFPYIGSAEATGWLVWDKWPGADGGLGNPVEMACTNLWSGFRLVRCMWGGYYKAAGEHREPHPTQKPIGVVAPFVSEFVPENEIVVDLFGGSGTTMEAAERESRVAYLCEVELKYCAVTLERLSLLGLTPTLLP